MDKADVEILLAEGELNHLGRGFPMVLRHPDGMVLVKKRGARPNLAEADAIDAGLPQLVLDEAQLDALRAGQPETGGVRVTTSHPPVVWMVRRNERAGW